MIGAFVACFLQTAIAFVLPGVACVRGLSDPAQDGRRWCRYWVALAACTAIERPVVAAAGSWLPFAQEGRVVFAFWLANAGGYEVVYAHVSSHFENTMRVAVSRAVRLHRAHAPGWLASRS